MCIRDRCNTEELYVLHRQRLLSLIKSKVEDSQKAEDLLHDSFVKIETCCNNECECAQPRSYLFRTALNIVFDYIRNRKKKGVVPSSAIESIGTNEKSVTSGKCDLLSCINSFLQETSIENRIAFERVDMLQIPQVQVAKELDIPLPTLKSRVQRTRKFLKNKLNTCCPDSQTTCI